MEEMNNNSSSKQTNTKAEYDGFKFLLFRTIFVLLLAVAIIVIRYIGKNTYFQIKQCYNNYISVNITADYYLGGS